ncbi:hypothetical protein [Rhizobium sp. Leaf262]|uniref:hypothetical protein n=1 Tax=Rhizobium sp. Leaf262 TaxID=1736312 RepID=UPI000A7437C5|nr:hypothetical protein [Rhizobium sp. Leaf262]
MRLTICVVLLLILPGFLNAVPAAQMAGDGNWGGALGVLTGPMIVFLCAHTLIYYGVVLVRSPAGLRSFSQTKLTYISFALALMSILGSLGDRANPPV